MGTPNNMCALNLESSSSSAAQQDNNNNTVD